MTLSIIISIINRQIIFTSVRVVQSFLKVATSLMETASIIIIFENQSMNYCFISLIHIAKILSSLDFQNQAIFESGSVYSRKQLIFQIKLTLILRFDQNIKDIFQMSQAGAPECISAIFKQIDTNNDGLISRQDLQVTKYFQTLFEGNQNVLIGFNKVHNQMKQKDFVFLVNAYRLKLHDFAIAKFEISQILDKYILVSAPGIASPHLKQSFLKFTAQTEQLAKQKMHSISLEFGVDKQQQEKKIEQLHQVLGHKPHQVFVLLRFKTSEKGAQVAQKLQKLLQQVQEFAQGLAPEIQTYVKMFKIYARYGNGYTYLIVEIDNPFIDNLVSFLNEIVQAITPECLLKFKAKLSSNVKNILKQSFTYEKSGGQILAEFDIDYVTLKKIKEIMGDNVRENPGQQSPFPQLLTLLFEELKLSVQFNNLGEALQSIFQIEAFPTPFTQLASIRELSIKETLGQVSQGSGALIDQLKSSCEAEGELSLNFHDFFVKVAFDLQVEDAFDLL